MKRKLGFILLLMAISTSAFAQVWSPPANVREIAVNGLPDIAITSMDNLGPIIYYNPTVVANTDPDLVLFFKAHEYGHVYLDHVRLSLFISNPYSRAWTSQRFEKEADCYAAEELESVLPQAVNKAHSWFFSQGNFRATPNHPTGFERAANIANNCGGALPPPPPPPTSTLFCCNAWGARVCPLMNLVPVGSPCMCPGVPGVGSTCF